MEKSIKPSRRNFLKQASLISATTITTPAILGAFPTPGKTGAGDQFSFLFQGDSITDGNRSRDLDWNHVLGHGYAYLIAARLWYQFPPKKFQFFNRGISGNQVTDLVRRWQPDTLSLKPDLISILIGVNDVLSAVNGNKNSTVSGFEKNYRALLEQAKQQLPSTEIVICEPFILPVGQVKENWNDFKLETTRRQELARQLAVEFKTIYVPLQDRFNEAAEKYPPYSYWLWDGIHPMPNGHELIAVEWIRQVRKKLKFIA
jgi:lysophospholipase L1-like esterase